MNKIYDLDINENNESLAFFPVEKVVKENKVMSLEKDSQKAIAKTLSAEEKAVIGTKKKEELAQFERNQELIDKEHVNFGKCPIRFLAIEDDEGNEIYGLKTKEPSGPTDKFNCMNKLTATQDILLSRNIVDSAIGAQPQSPELFKNTNIVNQVLADFEPKDSLEAKLSLQAHTLYTRGLQYLEKADHQTQIPQSEFYVKNAVKLLRLHNETVEALSRYRRNGEQRVHVEHVHVHNGGQAIVGNVTSGGGGKQ